MSEQKKQKGNLIVQHNCLIEANYDLTLQEKRVVLWLASQVKPDDVDFKEHVIKISDFCKIAGLKSKNMHKEIEKTTLNLINRSLQIYSSSENRLLQVAWLNSADYLYSEGSVKLCFSPKLKPYLLELKNCFTKFNLENMMLFKSAYAIRMYELLKQYQKSGVREIRITDLRKILGISVKQYSLYSNLKKKIIENSKKEINQKSDLLIDFLEIKNGRKVDSIKFIVETKKHVVEHPVVLLEESKSFGISTHSLEQLREEFSDDAVNQGLLSLKTYKGTVKNPVLFLKKAIKEGWQPFQEKKDQDRSNDLVEEINHSISMLDESPVCLEIRKLFLERQGVAEYKSWIQPICLQVEGISIVAVVQNKFAQDWLEVNYAKQLSDYADGKEIVFRLERSEVQVLSVSKKNASKLKKVPSKKSLQKLMPSNADESIDTEFFDNMQIERSIEDEEAIGKIIRDVSESKKKRVAQQKQVTVEETTVEVVKKKSLWERITGLWK